MLDDDDVFEELNHLDIQHAAALTVVYRAELFGHPYEVGPESVDAIYLPESHELAYGNDASHRALARELARAIAPDDDPGALAMRIEPILSAGSLEEAHRALDDFGIAKLDSTELEAVWSATAEVSDDLPDTDALPDNEFADTDHEDDDSGRDAGQDDGEETDSSPGAGLGTSHASGGGGGGLGHGMRRWAEQEVERSHMEQEAPVPEPADKPGCARTLSSRRRRRRPGNGR